MENEIRCRRCNRPLIADEKITIYNDNFFCEDCTHLFGTCLMCVHSQKCDFRDNPIEIPAVVEKSIQRGLFVIQVNDLNPERIKATCVASGCPCLSEDGSQCLRQYGTCKNYKEIEF